MAADPQCVVVAHAAMKAGDEATFAAAMANLGVALELPAFRAFCAAHDEWGELVGKRLLELVYGALHNELGFAFAADYLRTMLVARTPDHVAIGAQPGTTVRQPFPEGGWPIARWSKTNPAKNSPLVAAWLGGIATHAHVMVVRRVATATGAEDTAKTRTDGDALFAALCADPTDVGTRAVYADWLIERGDPRGEIMRLYAEGKRAEARLRAHVARDVIFEHVRSYVRRADDWTGLIEGVEIAAGDLARHAKELFARHPIHAVTLIATEPKQLKKLACVTDAPLDRVRTLMLEARRPTGQLVAIEPSALCGTRIVANLRTLRVIGVGDDLSEWQRFLGGLGAPHLEAFTLGDVASAEIARFVAAPTTLPQLRALSLWQQPWLRRGTASAEDALSIVRAVVQRERLAKVLIAGWKPGLDVMATIATMLAEAPEIVDVTLSASIDDRAVRALARGKFERVSVHGAMSAAALGELIERLPLRALEVWLDGIVDDAIVRVLETAPARLAHVHWMHPDLAADQATRIATTRTLEEHVARR